MDLGVLDVGTNSIQLLMTRLRGGRFFEVLGRAREMTRLGDGSLKSGRLSAEKIEQGVAAVKRFARLARGRQITRLIGIATAAVREAANGAEFTERIRQECEVDVRTISGDEEARLIYLAARHSMDLSGMPSLIVDIGGGSVELVVGTDQRLLWSCSLKLGAARLRDLFLSRWPPDRADHDRVHQHVWEALSPVLPALRRLPVRQVIGTSGTIRSLAILAGGMRFEEDSANVQGRRVQVRSLRKLHRRLASADSGDLARLRDIDPQRRDQLLTGACVLLEILEDTSVEELSLCDKGVLEGVVLDVMATACGGCTADRETPNPRLRSVYELAWRCGFDGAHAQTTARLALSIFNALKLKSGLHAAARELLEYGALLHDIGYLVGYRMHHKHGSYLVKHAPMLGFTPAEVEILACLVRYHRNRDPKRKDSGLLSLSPVDCWTVKVLTAILRIADALDRSHFGVIDSVRVVNRPGNLTLRATARQDAAMELWAARHRVALLEQVLGRAVTIELVSASGSGPAPHAAPRGA